MKRIFILIYFSLLIVVGGCKKKVEGCTDCSAANHNSAANQDDGNCCYKVQGSGVTDIDGNKYKTVVIGTQEWMAENLNTSRFADGDSISEVSSPSVWETTTDSAAWCYLFYDSQYEDVYGKLYNWFAVHDSRKICPTGWHVSRKLDWEALQDYLDNCGHQNKEATILKSLAGWSAGNEEDAYGFAALPGNKVNFLGGFPNDPSSQAIGTGLAGYWWTPAVYEDMIGLEAAMGYFIRDEYEEISIAPAPKRSGYCVRCVKD